MNTSPEVHFAQLLASNQPKVREKTLKKIEIWLSKSSVSKDVLTEDGLLKLWKGIFFYFWHCDKPLVQEERAEILSKYVHIFKKFEGSLLFIDTFFQTMSREWITIDKFRLEKYLMLIRNFLHESFQLLKSHEWEEECIEALLEIFKKTFLYPAENSTPYSLKMHLTDIYLEELAKVGSNEVTAEIVHQLIIPFYEVLLKCDDSIYLGNVKKEIFLFLIHQDVDTKEFQEFPTLNFDAESIQDTLRQTANKKGIRRKNMKIIYEIIKQFEDYKNGYDKAEKIFANQSKSRKLRKRDIEQATESLLREEEDVKKENKKFRKHKKVTEEEVSIGDLDI